MAPRLIKDWQWVLTKGWSIRWLVVAGILSGLEVYFSFFTNDPPLPRGLFAMLSSITTVAAFGARFVAQRDES